MDVEFRYPELFQFVPPAFEPEDAPRMLHPIHVSDGLVLAAVQYDFAGCYTVQNPSSALFEKDVVAALLATGGNFNRMAKLLGRSRRMLESFVLRSPDLNALRADLRASLVDEIEDGYFVDAMLGDKEARKFFLRTIGRDRGYVERNESSLDGKFKLESTVDFSKVPDDVLEALALNAKVEGD